ncbi:Phosphoacetylglucosamine mutase [Glycine max]|nr:Phosphoacetylglucosamine mutase [Glycine max]
MNEEQQCLLLSSASHFWPPKGVKLSYGTGGFRADASLLQSTVYRVGILAALRSLKTRSVIGLMITASHNKVSDNGVKIAYASGGMLSQHWEPFVDALANAPSPQHLLLLINEFVEKEGISVDGDWQVEGVTSIVGAVATDMGILTTPQLHWMVRARNKGMKASEQDYFEQLSSSFRCLVDLIPAEKCKFDGVNDKVVVDGSNGVRNSSEDGGVLNDGVGADYVQKEKVLPNNFGSKDTGIRCVSLDGDADRLVYFIVPPKSSGRIDLVDGDKILSLFALFIREQLSFLNEKEDMKNCHQAHVGVIQTAYANGASTNYLKLLGLEVNFTPTGVKYLHEKATEFDIGIYFEANGHGTVLFSESFIESLEARTNEISLGSKGSEGEKAALRLLALSKLINQAVGDALSGFLLVEVILQHMGWLINKWNELYHDLPSKQLKNPQGRCFVRPSGTEDVVRVYAEASTQEAADTLANCVAKLVDQFLGFNSS